MRIHCLHSILLLFLAFSAAGQTDIWPPDTPELDTVSVYDNVTGYSIVTWFPSDSADVEGYIMYRNINTQWVPIDTLPSTARSFIDYGAEAHYHSEQYRIAAIDEAGNKSLMTAPEGYHTTIYVFPYQETENCQPLIRLHWNKYLNWPEGIKRYEVWQSVNFGSYSLLYSSQGDVNGYKHFIIDDTTSYCFYIKAISNNNRTSTSNVTCIYIDYPNIPSFVTIDNVTLTAPGRLGIFMSMDNSAQVRNYRLERARKGTGNYTTVASVSNYNLNVWTYSDAVDTQTEWVYRMVSTDACGNTLNTSNTATNIVVYGYSDRELHHYLSWNQYRYFNGDVDYYELYRSVDDKTPELIATLSDTLYTDDVSEFANGRSYGKFTYMVYARETVNPPGKGYSSRSSDRLLTQFSRVFVPNTFTPNSDTLNTVFKPVVSFVQKDGYYFAVYSRWGNKIFETSDVNEAWDGLFNDRPIKQDTYVYVLKYLTTDGQAQEKSGYVYIFYPPSD